MTKTDVGIDYTAGTDYTAGRTFTFEFCTCVIYHAVHCTAVPCVLNKPSTKSKFQNLMWKFFLKSFETLQSCLLDIHIVEERLEKSYKCTAQYQMDSSSKQSQVKYFQGSISKALILRNCIGCFGKVEFTSDATCRILTYYYSHLWSKLCLTEWRWALPQWSLNWVWLKI